MFFVDADERVSSALAEEVRQVVAASQPGGPYGYWIPRKNVIFGHTMRAAGWYPDHQLRLLHRDHARYDEARPVHEVVVLDGPAAGFLSQPFIHFNYQSIHQFVRKQRRYTAFEAAELLASRGRPRVRALLGQPAREFWRRYVALRGWQDGPVGLLLSLAMAYFAYERTRLARQAHEPLRLPV
jgi:hypothetical protein